MPFPSTAWNINVISSGGVAPYQGTSFQKVGTMPPQSGMPVYINLTQRAFGPARFIQAIDPTYGFITVAPSGAVIPDAAQFRHYPHQVNIFLKDAATYGFPSGANNTLLQNVIYTPPSGAPRGTDLMPGGGFIYG